MNKHFYTSDNGSVYTGHVEVKVNKKNTPYRIIKTKNTGTGAFHRYILKALIDGNVDSNLRPYGIKLYKLNGVLTFDTIFPGVTLTDEPKEGNGTTVETIETKSMGIVSYSVSPYYIKYHFLVPENFCNGDTCYYIGLCNGYGELYAVAVVGDPSTQTPLKLDVGSNIDITWTLTVSSSEKNTTSSEETGE